MTAIKLSPRLAAVKNLVNDQARVADIGSDHAYLAAALLLEKKSEFALVGEVAQGPLENAIHTVATYGLSNQVTCRLADGLAAIEPDDQIETVVIAGMGGLLIEKILTAGQNQGPFDQLILQPNTDQAAVRLWLSQNGYQIDQEKIVQEGHHRYEIIVAVPGQQELTRAEWTFGPKLLQAKDPVFLAKWEQERNRAAEVLSRLESAQQKGSEKYVNLQEKLNFINQEVFDGQSK
ncbi:class I SAM-dependent methyltransferase [Fructobacillus evanidus]|uniref:tRNA A22 N1-methylase (TrmK) n=1 Tax=Fructobacillus evanidus TaxID=3064281 RepID=A0ABN9YXL7_9LACO|nr:tRNA A22 N1-methylase (TrmK) [Fructobacillus sp. LMG 32999]CAK1246060.1 tRNA A22 N1-methylase (TrmK) [Fructobacillus sp. LMG 32999]CAK1250933.1 tRNA A22 N1-methylase (TrmK) [Fructobacillus sp. LMG 32999]CAK1251302.1 tRNA A22 N1-methylase (TrmK) [Fructobacillus sp. LMG 32999]CAK1251516.1 tRNA A22 N1-methylase (TrmK) [Fructobacillus sp. LMG 32999]